MQSFLTIILLLALSIFVVNASQLQVCDSRDCISCRSYNTSLVSGVLGLDTAYIVCGSNLTSIYGVNSMGKELQIYYGQPGVCQSYFGGSYLLTCGNAVQVIDNHTLGVCQAQTIYTCEPGKLVAYQYGNSQCVGSYTIHKRATSSCLSFMYGMCAHLKTNINSLVIAVCIFPLFLGICFSVYSSLPCLILCDDGIRIAPAPQRDEIIARSSLQREVQAMMNLNGPASPSTVSEYSSSSFRGNAILLASCLMSSTNLLLLSFIAGAILERSVSWLRTISYLLISVVGFFPSAPPAKIRERTPALWCSFGSVLCDGRLDTSIIQNAAHMCSFFVSIILFIASELIEYGGKEAIQVGDYSNTSVTFPIVLMILLGLLIVFQAPVNIAKAPFLSCLQYGFMTEKPTKEQKKYLNACAAAAFLIEVVLATCLICFGLYEELLPVSVCVDVASISLFPWIIVVVSCIVGYSAGFVFTFLQYLSDNDEGVFSGAVTQTKNTKEPAV